METGWQYPDRAKRAYQSAFRRTKDCKLRGVGDQDNGRDLVVSSAAQLHGWNQPAGVNVGVQVNVPLPGAEERAEMNAIDRKLDAIAAKLKAAQNARLTK